MKYKVCEWEDNGYHDSYFYGVYYDDADGLMHCTELGATAYVTVINEKWAEAISPDARVVECCRVLLEKHIFQSIREAEHADVLTPQDAKEGAVMELLVPHQRQLKAAMPCDRCDAKGYWQNPRKPEDKRPCFTCHGLGTIACGDPLKDAKGKIMRETITAGTRITVLSVKAFGTFYKKGYNKPDRSNRNVTARLGDTIVHVPLAKLRQAKDPMPDAELRERAVSLSYHHAYGAMFGCRAWLSANYVAAAAKRLANDESTDAAA